VAGTAARRGRPVQAKTPSEEIVARCSKVSAQPHNGEERPHPATPFKTSPFHVTPTERNAAASSAVCPRVMPRYRLPCAFRARAFVERRCEGAFKRVLSAARWSFKKAREVFALRCRACCYAFCMVPVAGERTPAWCMYVRSAMLFILHC